MCKDECGYKPCNCSCCNLFCSTTETKTPLDVINLIQKEKLNSNIEVKSNEVLQDFNRNKLEGKSYIDIQQAVDDYNKSSQWNRKPATNEFYPSELSGCIRQAVKHRENLIHFDTQTLRYFAIGKMFHKFIQTEVSLGFIKQPVEFEKRLNFKYGKYKFTGHVDMFDGTTVYDFKTTKNAEISTKYNMQTSYRYQTSCYVHGCKIMGYDAKEAVILYIDKTNLTIIPKKVDLIPMNEIEGFCNNVMLACQHYRDTQELPDKDKCFSCKMENTKSD